MATKKKAATEKGEEPKFFGDKSFAEFDDRGRTKFDRCWEAHLKEYPPGSLNLPPLLEQRRLEYKLAEGFFRYQCVGHYVLVSQITYDDEIDRLLAGSPLVRPQAHEAADKNRSYLGVLVSAGSSALDSLASEGIGLGHIVRFMRYTPFKCQVDVLMAGHETYTAYGVDLVDSDIRASMDLAMALREGKCRRDVIKHENGAREHVFYDENGELWKPEAAYVQENF